MTYSTPEEAAQAYIKANNITGPTADPRIAAFIAGYENKAYYEYNDDWFAGRNFAEHGDVDNN